MFVISAISIILALFAVIISAIVAYYVKKLSKVKEEYEKEHDKRLTKLSSTDFLDEPEADETCEICFGTFEEGDVSVCECGKKFHRDCVEITDECPYCHTGPDRMTVRPILRLTCMACGKVLSNSICECGTIHLRKDRTFECECGENVFVNDINENSKCPKCGLKYKLTYDRPGKPI